MLLSIMFILFALIDPNALIVLVMPLIVWLATWFVNWIKVKLGSTGFSGTVIVTLIAPILAWVSAEIYGYLAGGVDQFWVLFGLGMLGTFVNEFVKQWSQTIKKTQTTVKTKLIG